MGNLVGARDGNRVGIRVGNRVGDSVGNRVGGRVGARVDTTQRQLHSSLTKPFDSPTGLGQLDPQLQWGKQVSKGDPPVGSNRLVCPEGHCQPGGHKSSCPTTPSRFWSSTPSRLNRKSGNRGCIAVASLANGVPVAALCFMAGPRRPLHARGRRELIVKEVSRVAESQGTPNPNFSHQQAVGGRGRRCALRS